MRSAIGFFRLCGSVGCFVSHPLSAPVSAIKMRPPHPPAAARRCAVTPRPPPTRLCAQPPRAPPATPDLDRLATLLATADSPASPPAAADAAEAEAVALATQLAEAGTLRGFGRAARVPRRHYTLADLRLARIEPTALLAPTDATLAGVRKQATLAATAGGAAAIAALHPTAGQLLATVVAGLAAATADAIATGGGISALALDTVARVVAPGYRTRVAAHEAGHFLTAYLSGVLPKGYDLTSLDAVTTRRAWGVQAGTRLCDGAFRAAVARGSITSTDLHNAATISLAGVAAEYVTSGGQAAEGGLADVAGLDELLRALGFSERKAADSVRMAILDAVTLLRRHEAAHKALADAMADGKGVAACVGVVEARLGEDV